MRMEALSNRLKHTYRQALKAKQPTPFHSILQGRTRQHASELLYRMCLPYYARNIYVTDQALMPVACEVSGNLRTADVHDGHRVRIDVYGPRTTTFIDGNGPTIIVALYYVPGELAECVERIKLCCSSVPVIVVLFGNGEQYLNGIPVETGVIIK